MAEQAHDYHRGEMDIHAQQSTFHAVMTGTKWSSLAVAVGVLFFTLLFCTEAGFGTAFLSAIILAAVGIFGLRSRAPAH
ncbi:MAG TPA: aa3-type cytochrome c oxidase subunit IV [Caulobacteraceae bacterium]|jgi:hypothetical protein|nr:aa3-type cytochrome c oxidase subunit IV [Caulobacteraceae bacterium]